MNKSKLYVFTYEITCNVLQPQPDKKLTSEDWFTLDYVLIKIKEAANKGLFSVELRKTPPNVLDYIQGHGFIIDYNSNYNYVTISWKEAP